MKYHLAYPRELHRLPARVTDLKPSSLPGHAQQRANVEKLRDEVELVWDVVNESNEFILTPCGRYGDYDYQAHPDELAMIQRLQRACGERFKVRSMPANDGRNARFQAIKIFPMDIELEV